MKQHYKMLKKHKLMSIIVLLFLVFNSCYSKEDNLYWINDNYDQILKQIFPIDDTDNFECDFCTKQLIQLVSNKKVEFDKGFNILFRMSSNDNNCPEMLCTINIFPKYTEFYITVMDGLCLKQQLMTLRKEKLSINTKDLLEQLKVKTYCFCDFDFPVLKKLVSKINSMKINLKMRNGIPIAEDTKKYEFLFEPTDYPQQIKISITSSASHSSYPLIVWTEELYSTFFSLIKPEMDKHGDLKVLLSKTKNED